MLALDSVISRCCCTAIVYEKNPSYLKHDYKVELDI